MIDVAAVAAVDPHSTPSAPATVTTRVSEGVFNPEYTEDSILRGVVTADFHAALDQILAAALHYAESGGVRVGQMPANHGRIGSPPTPGSRPYTNICSR